MSEELKTAAGLQYRPDDSPAEELSDREYLRREMARRELARRKFVKYLPYVHGKNWKDTRMATYLANEVQTFLETDTGNAYDILVIQTPPQVGKSTTITESLPAWAMGRFPEWRVILGSYNDETAQSFDKEGMHIGATLGNQVFYGESDTGEPFALMFIDPSMIAMIGASFTAMALDGSAQAVVSVFGEGAKVNKLDNRCLDLAWLPTTKEELKEVYPETTMTFTYGGSQFFQAHEIPIELVVGNQYIVTFEGTEYPCEAKVIGDESVSIYYIGNIALNYPNEPDLAPNTGEPFVYSVQDVGGDDNGARFYIEGEFTGDEYTAERTIAVYAVVQVPNKLPAEFLPDELYLTSPGGKKFKITVSDDGVLSAAAAT